MIWCKSLTATGARESTMGRANAETTMPVVRNQASSRHGFDLDQAVNFKLGMFSLHIPWWIISPPLGYQSWNWRYQVEDDHCERDPGHRVKVEMERHQELASLLILSHRILNCALNVLDDIERSFCIKFPWCYQQIFHFLEIPNWCGEIFTSLPPTVLLSVFEEGHMKTYISIVLFDSYLAVFC